MKAPKQEMLIASGHESGITVSFVNMAQNIIEVILLLTIMNTHTRKKTAKKPTHQNPSTSVTFTDPSLNTTI